jgi:zinc transporter 1
MDTVIIEIDACPQPQPPQSQQPPQSHQPPQSQPLLEIVPWYHDDNSRRLIIMSILTLLFCLSEIALGIYIGSLAVLADAFHMISDEIALVVGFIVLRVSKKKETLVMSYGWSRAEVVGGLINGVFLLSVCLFIFLEAIGRFIDIPEIDHPMWIVVIGVGGLLINVIGLLLFAGHSHIHSHTHKHEHEHTHTIKDMGVTTNGATTNGATTNGATKIAHSEHRSNLNLHGLFLHLMGDALGSVSAAVVGLCIWFIPGTWKYYLDPVASLIVSVIILNSSIPLVKSCVRILMQSTPDIDLTKLRTELNELIGETNIHDFHVWQMTPNEYVCTIHILCRQDTDFMTIATSVKNILHQHNIHATTIQPEWENTSSVTFRCGGWLGEHTTITPK